jgi:Rieske Fe-S protein
MGPGAAIGRRAFCRRAIEGALGIALAGAAAGCAAAPMYRAGIAGDRATVPLDRFPASGAARDALLVSVPGRDEAVLLVRSGAEIFALSATCTHQGCQVRPSGAVIECPCHGSTFDDRGRVVRGPATEPLPRYRVTVTESAIEIDLSAPERGS